MNHNVKFSDEAECAINLIQNSNQNLFITGKAGTGKSTLLAHIISKSGDMVVLAPTGIAAIHIKGETIHSFFKLKPGYELDEAKHMRIFKDQVDKFSTLKTILIDEISMVRADILDAIDVFLRRVRKSNEFFGGVRMIFFGDLYQLPPVVTKDEKEVFYQKYQSEWFFSAQVFQKPDLFTDGFSLKKVELTKVYRQSDQSFIKCLNAIRDKSVTQTDLDYLNRSVCRGFIEKKEENWIHLVATNAQAQRINNAKLEGIESPVVEFLSCKEGNIGNLRPNDEKIQVKKGAQIMFINNDSEKRWVNGSLGMIEEIVSEYENGETYPILMVRLDNGKLVKVDKHTWPISKYVFKYGEFVREEIGYFTQLPVKLAWAITIHKSQGKSFHHVVIDMGSGSFAHGQCYVALSRCTKPEGVRLKQAIRMNDVIIDETVMNFS
eukprot:TRINITY_DN131_c0_g2_i1.p1 TRINITY_DN131_c0_g2~~TRINITY_DN131_c0_g2_i1.p1  ORF type:complete len:435 (+),score=33.07 TRINITY_DN131_c0_g2_i1:1525-2829(+)